MKRCNSNEFVCPDITSSPDGNAGPSGRGIILGAILRRFKINAC